MGVLAKSWPPRYPYPNPQNLYYVSFHGKGEIRFGMELRLLVSWLENSEVIPDYLDGSSGSTRNLKCGEGFRRENQMGGKARRAWLAVAGSEDGRMGLKARECGRPLEVGRALTGFLP